MHLDWFEIQVGTEPTPILADHGFRQLRVLPGSFFLAEAERLLRKHHGGKTLEFHSVVFASAVLLPERTAPLAVLVRETAVGTGDVSFFEGTVEEIRPAANPAACATLHWSWHAPSAEAPAHRPNEAAHSEHALSGADFYRAEERNGNLYGSNFRVFSKVEASTREAFGRYTTDPLAPLAALDGAPQLLSACVLPDRRTFFLRSIARVILHASVEAIPGSASARVELAQAGEELAGDVIVFDREGAALWIFEGVRLGFLEPVAAAESARLCVAANFTAEPLEETLHFWNRHWGGTLLPEFAPYGQVLQQLLDPASAFSRNSGGVNILLLALEEWLQQAPPAAKPTAPERLASAFGTETPRRLPNGMEILELNAYETDHLYQEIFVDRAYLRHGVALAPDATVLDIGANIGMFSMFILSCAPAATIYAFEPAPRTFEILRANCSAYGENGTVRAFPFGVGEAPGEADFTFYEHSSVFSTFHGNAEADRDAVEAVVRNRLRPFAEGAEDDAVQTLAEHRLRATSLRLPITTVSEIIRENELERIDLLKIDAEKSEAAILRGIEESHWPLIRQLVVEIHDPTGNAVRSIVAELQQRGFHCAVHEEKALADSGLFNLYAVRSSASAGAETAELRGGPDRVEEFCAALEAFAARCAGPLVLVTTPPTPAASASSALGVAAAEQRALSVAQRHAQIQVVSSKDLLARYATSGWHDPHAAELGHMPFSREGYAALATAIYRAARPFPAPLIKVLALDADNTLWQGQCGDEGPDGIVLSSGFQALQEFMRRQKDAGTLLVLCSKNDCADVQTAFSRHPEFPLKWEDFAAIRVNWQPKSENLRTIAEELQLGLDSFLFLDDQPVECAEVAAGCPEVLSVRLPADPETLPTFLDQLWLLDRGPATAEDRARSAWHHTNADREAQRAAAPTFAEFIAGLQLRVEIAPAREDQFARIAQLTLRTNQFNFTGIRRTAAELEAAHAAGAECLAVSVRDRFGDYGLVGAMTYRLAGDCLMLENLLLSCRALGKGIEYQMLAAAGKAAVERGLASVSVNFHDTGRNAPACAFLSRFGLRRSGADHHQALHLSSVELAELQWQAEEAPGVGKPLSPRAQERWDARRLAAAMQEAAEGLFAPGAVLAALHAARAHQMPMAQESRAGNALERKLAEIWARILGRASVGRMENFFEAGGSSLKAVMVVAAIRQELQVNLSLVALFECPTIRQLAERLARTEEALPEAAAAAAARGRQRRQPMVRRRSAA